MKKSSRKLKRKSPPKRNKGLQPLVLNLIFILISIFSSKVNSQSEWVLFDQNFESKYYYDNSSLKYDAYNNQITVWVWKDFPDLKYDAETGLYQKYEMYKFKFHCNTYMYRFLGGELLFTDGQNPKTDPLPGIYPIPETGYVNKLFTILCK